MEDLNKPALAKGIFYNKKSGLCIFETKTNNKIKWFNVHIDNIEGKFYQGCQANLYQHYDEILKAVIIEPDKKKKNKAFLLISITYFLNN